MFLENISEQLVVAIKVEAANSEQATEVRKTSEKKLCSTILTTIIVIFCFVVGNRHYALGNKT